MQQVCLHHSFIVSVVHRHPDWYNRFGHTPRNCTPTIPRIRAAASVVAGVDRVIGINGDRTAAYISIAVAGARTRLRLPPHTRVHPINVLEMACRQVDWGALSLHVRVPC